MVQLGDSAMRIDHYNFLRTLEDMYGVPPTGKAANAEPITGVWKVPRPSIFRVPPPNRPAPRSR